MSDILCAVCGEPWEQYHLMHDEAPWVYYLFKKGAGCPSCEGVAPRGDDEETVFDHMKSVMMNSEDPDSYELMSNFDREERPRWEEPKPKVLWTCDGCGVSAVISNEAPIDSVRAILEGKPREHGGPDHSWDSCTDVDLYVGWDGGKKVHYCPGGSGFAYSFGGAAYKREHEATIEPSFTITIDGEEKKLCPGCGQSCKGCGETLFQGHAEEKFCSDTYDTGGSFPHPSDCYGGPLCIGCLEEAENEDRAAARELALSDAAWNVENLVDNGKDFDEALNEVLSPLVNLDEFDGDMEEDVREMLMKECCEREVPGSYYPEDNE